MHDWTILCDFDGTIALDDVTDALLSRFALPEWEAIEARWRDGAIGSRECMTAQVALIDASLDEVDAVLDALPIDPAFPGFVAEARRQGMPVQIVSDGLDYAIRRILARHGLSDLPIRANRLLHDGTRGWQLASPHADAACGEASGTCKCAIARGHDRVLMIGDGLSDFCVSGVADFVFAKKKLITHCRRAGIPHRPIVDFSDACALLDTLPELVGDTLPELFPLRVHLA
ncbi:MtnX-like HAD-IB family phosphatase [Oleiagrimonas soli]|uniref:Phosphatase n=1 Tax=Oleiagrimonas soli TaxID=1543381 RepID=A0A099CVT7_9GAMM|nr:MtnX-like HAD-IB family phosphatase [Oleiagrimonas soli]KGI77747.1 phosphatase [Oleiagrimonas soli]MBB6183938.1 2,3-diketo-5-methylthio-1-phosphopentane phosphatase [Oleiagrimonas soli]